MTTKEWQGEHSDVKVVMESGKTDLNLIIKMGDSNWAVERTIPFSVLPLDQGELILEDYLCAIYEQLYSSIKKRRRANEDYD